MIARLSRPMPLQVQRELNVCIEMDQFEVALISFRKVIAAVHVRPTEMSPYASPAALRAAWKDSLAELQASFERTDERAQALIKSIKVMLALE